MERIEVSGIILAENNDVESVTVYNASSNKGTITNSKGEFIIMVALNDIIEIAALQFQTVSVTIDAHVLETKQLKIQLIEQVNQLDAVLLSSGLLGNIEADILNVKAIKPLVIDMGNLNIDFEYNDDKAFDNTVVVNELIKITNKGQFYNGIDFAAILGLNKLLKRKSKKKDIYNEKKDLTKDILDVYSPKFISETCNIPFEKVESFIAYIEAKGIKNELFDTKNEVYLIEFIIKQSKEFLKLRDAKD
ncbi:carboxypeptidase-like regulatory domain-containing protein [Gelatiniphilus marinus]|uniref:Carboxypeptidase-like regulatory domain-containing protein n=1 Tax=Gelatiniphilus marinus TaxID=1759464 RepID=A0ABW5JT25_9FLAO